MKSKFRNQINIGIHISIANTRLIGGVSKLKNITVAIFNRYSIISFIKIMSFPYGHQILCLSKLSSRWMILDEWFSMNKQNTINIPYYNIMESQVTLTTILFSSVSSITTVKVNEAVHPQGHRQRRPKRAGNKTWRYNVQSFWNSHTFDQDQKWPFPFYSSRREDDEILAELRTSGSLRYVTNYVRFVPIISFPFLSSVVFSLIGFHLFCARMTIDTKRVICYIMEKRTKIVRLILHWIYCNQQRRMFMACYVMNLLQIW